MTTEERVITQIAEANPLTDAAQPTPQERAEAERILQRVLGDAGTAPPRRPRPRVGILAQVASVLVVLVVAAVVLRTGGSSTTGSTPSRGLTLTLEATPTASAPKITASAMTREMTLMRRRLGSLGRGFEVRQAGSNEIVVTGPKARAAERARIVRLITRPAQLRFYDWEANVLTADGKTAASGLLSQTGSALSVSQGGGTGPGFPGAGTMSLYDAVKLAGKQPVQGDRRHLSRVGPEYYVFGTPGSEACAAAARADHTQLAPGVHCLLAGPVDLGNGAGPRQAVAVAAARFPLGIVPGGAQVMVVPQGTVVLQAERPHASAPVAISDPTAQFFVLRDDVALPGSDIVSPKASTDQGGEPAINFGFTRAGLAAFRRTTRVVAHRGPNVSLAGSMVEQHFAIALDNQLLSVPAIDFRVYPDGIIGGGGADITGGFTARSAKDLATELRYGALPLSVRVVP